MLELWLVTKTPAGTSFTCLDDLLQTVPDALRAAVAFGPGRYRVTGPAGTVLSLRVGPGAKAYFPTARPRPTHSAN